MTRRIAICADDFGAFPGADEGILRLADAGRLGGASCQVHGAAFAGDGLALRERLGSLDAGLHLDLAAGRGGLVALLARAYARALDPRALRDEIAAQLDRFERVLGRPPAFVDGHQHVHQLPAVRAALLEVLEGRYRSRPPLVRNTVPRGWHGAKALAIAALGGYTLRRALRARGVPHNADFRGVYALDGRDYRPLFLAWLAGASDGTLFFCHPGVAAGDAGDPIGPARAAELAYLSSAAFEGDCRAAGVERVRISALGPRAGP